MTHPFDPLSEACDRDLQKRVISFLLDRGYLALRLVTVEVADEEGHVGHSQKSPMFSDEETRLRCVCQP